jgi:hypothetical protein
MINSEIIPLGVNKDYVQSWTACVFQSIAGWEPSLRHNRSLAGPIHWARSREETGGLAIWLPRDGHMEGLLPTRLIIRRVRISDGAAWPTEHLPSAFLGPSFLIGHRNDILIKDHLYSSISCLLIPDKGAQDKTKAYEIQWARTM